MQAPSLPSTSPALDAAPALPGTGEDAARLFTRLRSRLIGIAYRMLGERAQAEEVVQDAWLRWHQSAPTDLASAEAWLVTVTTRLAIDRLRSAKVEREHYVGTWLPEPLLTNGAEGADAAPSPEQELERADNVSVAFLFLLERLGPQARAAFLLREVFDVDYGEMAGMLGKSEAACRQLVSRAKTQLKDERPRYTVKPAEHRRLLERLAQAMTQGDVTALQGLMDEDTTLISDGGGVVPSFGKPLVGAVRIANLYYVTHRSHAAAMRLELALINGQWGLLRFMDGQLESAQTCETDGTRIRRIHVQRNPEKLARLLADWQQGH